MELLEELAARGLVHQKTESGLDEALENDSLTAYIGFDPTASSLHIGSLLPALMLKRLQRAGHRPIAIVGGGTGMVGDPSGKDAERSLLDAETLAANTAGMRAQLERFLDFDGPRGALLVDNAEWLCTARLTDFLRDIGKHFSVNQMMARDSVKRRLEGREQGISYTEFSYMLLQAYDYLVLHERYGCTLQCGGSDQWGNIVSGADLVRRVHGKEVHGLTFPLLMRADGKKFGKSETGNVWLDPARTTAFEFYQYWINVADADVVDLLHKFTFLDLDAIAELARTVEADPGRREAQRVLAREVTTMVHGDEGRVRAEQTTETLFRGGDLRELSGPELEGAFRASPQTEVPRGDLEAGIPLVAILGDTGLCASRGRARQDVKGNAVSVNHVKVTDIDHTLTPADLLADRFIVLKRGRKTYHVLVVA